jgi:hypothetical protein
VTPILWVSIVVEKDHFLCEQARAFPLDGFPSGAAVLCSSGLHSMIPCYPGTQGQECPMHPTMLLATFSLQNVWS